jgi:hypothetical protein
LSYRLGRTEDDVDVKKAVDAAQVYYNAQEKRKWVGWVGKILMLRLHAQMAMEQADAIRVEQDFFSSLTLSLLFIITCFIDYKL